MASVADFPPKAPVNFPGPIGTKRRRMRSGGNVSTMTNNGPKLENISEEKTTQTSKCKGATTIPIFLKKTYKMIDTCDQSIASWTPDGDMFVVKDPELFATQVIPQYFDHNKFSSFARQLNFYGFRKMQSKPIKNSDYDAGTAKHVTFYNENFKRGRCDLLKKIQRSTRGGSTTTGQDQQKEILILRDQVSTLEQKITDMNSQFEERVRRLELEMLARMEQMMLAVQQQQSSQQISHLQKATSIGSNAPSVSQNWEPNALPFGRGTSINSILMNNAVAPVADLSVTSAANTISFQQPVQAVGLQQAGRMLSSNSASTTNSSMPAPATLPPHPKQKQLPLGGTIPGSMGAPPDRLSSLRGISQLTRGISSLSRGASTESAVLMRNSWEDKLFSMLMLDNNELAQNANAGNLFGVNNGVGPTPLTADNLSPPVVSNRSTDPVANGITDDMSSVSSSGMA